MKKLICSLMVATMLFSTVVSVAGASEINSAYSMCEDDSFREEEVEKQHDYYSDVVTDEDKEFSELEIKRNQGDSFFVINYFETYGLDESNISRLGEILKKCNFIAEEDIYNIFAYLADHEVDIKDCKGLLYNILKLRNLTSKEDRYKTIKLLFYLTKKGWNWEDYEDLICKFVPEKLPNDPDKVWEAMNTLSYFCKKFGTIIVFRNGDVITPDGYVMNANSKQYYYDDGVTPSGVDYTKPDHFNSENKLIVILDNIKKIVESDGMIIFKDEDSNIKFLNCSSDSEKTGILNSNVEQVGYYERVESIYKPIIIISSRGDISIDGKKLGKTEGWKDNTINELEEDIIFDYLVPVVSSLSENGDASSENIYLRMNGLPEIDALAKDLTISDEEHLANFASENYCQDAVFLALEVLEELEALKK